MAKKPDIEWCVMQTGKGFVGYVYERSYKKALAEALEQLGCHSSCLWLERAHNTVLVYCNQLQRNNEEINSKNLPKSI
jgi:hypothetical protein